MQDDLYECAKRTCRLRYRHREQVMVLEHRPGPKTLPTYRGTCPKCGHTTFFLIERVNSKDPSNPIVDPATDCAPKFDEGAAAVAAGTRPYGDWLVGQEPVDERTARNEGL